MTATPDRLEDDPETDDASMKRTLRNLPVLTGTAPEFDPTDLPDAPDQLFRDWLSAAIDAGCREPHAMTLATCRSDGSPDARVLILKACADQTWWFASSSDSAKGDQLGHNPNAALAFYWPHVARQVRVRGRVAPAKASDSSRDFAARSQQARAVATASKQSDVLTDLPTMHSAVDAAVAVLDAGEVGPVDHWTLYGLRADEVEFWQASTDRRHVRVRYRRRGQRWVTELLWP